MTKQYELHEWEGMLLVLTPSRKVSDMQPEANFDDTGMALCGRLLPNESLEQFALRAAEANKRHDAVNTDSDIASQRRTTIKIQRILKHVKNETITEHTLPLPVQI